MYKNIKIILKSIQIKYWEIFEALKKNHIWLIDGAVAVITKICQKYATKHWKNKLF